MKDEDRAAILAIARQHLGFKSFAVANSDREDFRSVAVWNVEKALQEAFEAGRNAK